MYCIVLVIYPLSLIIVIISYIVVIPNRNRENYNITSTGVYSPRFIVTSNYSHKSYVAERNRKNPNSWTCTCKGFLDAIRVCSDDKLCDHILEVIKQYKIIVPTIPKQVYLVPQEPIQHVIACTNCGTTKAGKKSSKQVQVVQQKICLN